MEKDARTFLSTMPNVAVPLPQRVQDCMASLLDENPLGLDQEEPVAKLQGLFLAVDANSCYGSLSFFDMSMGKPTGEHWALTEQLCASLLEGGLCSSVMLRQGCESKGFFGKRLSPAIIASPDFAKLTALKWFDLLDTSKLSAMVDTLELSAAYERYCENKWQSLVAECKADPRFVPVIARAGR